MPQATPTKPLPENIFAGGNPPPEENTNVSHPADAPEANTEKKETLVNENPEQTIARLTAQLQKSNETLQKVKRKYDEERLAKAGYAGGSQKFRLYLAIIGAMTQRGTFDSANFKGKPNASEIIRAHMDHAVGLTQVAYAAKEGKLD